MVWRNTTVPVRGRKFTGKKGVGDIIGLSDGIHIEIEVKVGKDTMRPEQIEHQNRILGFGGVYYVANSFAEFLAWWTHDKELDEA